MELNTLIDILIKFGFNKHLPYSNENTLVYRYKPEEEVGSDKFSYHVTIEIKDDRIDTCNLYVFDELFVSAPVIEHYSTSNTGISPFTIIQELTRNKLRDIEITNLIDNI